MKYTFYIAPSGSFDISNPEYFCVRGFQKEDDEMPYILICFFDIKIEHSKEIQEWMVEDLGFNRCKNPNIFRLNINETITPKEFIQFAKLFYEEIKTEFNLDIKLVE